MLQYKNGLFPLHLENYSMLIKLFAFYLRVCSWYFVFESLHLNSKLVNASVFYFIYNFAGIRLTTIKITGILPVHIFFLN